MITIEETDYYFDYSAETWHRNPKDASVFDTLHDAILVTLGAAFRNKPDLTIWDFTTNRKIATFYGQG